MCLDNPSAAQKEEFQFEIEQMKQLGSHPNVVSLVGCCTLQDEKFLVIEYVPFGDLLTWLRCRRNRVRKWEISTMYFELWKKGKGFASLKTRRNIPGFPLFWLRNIKYFHVISPLFLPLLTLLHHPPPALSTSAFRTPPVSYSPGFAPHLSSSIFSSEFSFQNATELESLDPFVNNKYVLLREQNMTLYLALQQPKRGVFTFWCCWIL